MTDRRWNIIAAVANEFLALRPPEYFICLENSTISFVRVSGSGRAATLYQEPRDISDPGAVASFCERLINRGSYYGQPVLILLCNRNAFTYIKRQGKLSAAELFEKISAIPRNNLAVMQTVLKRGGGGFLIWQAVDKNYLHGILEAAREYGLRATDITHLEMLLLANGPVPTEDHEALYLYQLPSGAWVQGVFKGNGDVLFSRIPEQAQSGSIEEVSERLVQTYGPWIDCPERQSFDMLKNSTKSRRLGGILRSRFLKNGAGSTAAYRVPGAKHSLVVKTAVNSNRLLTLSLASLALVLALVVTVTSIWAGYGTSQTESYQELYSSRLAMERELDSLSQMEKRLAEEQGLPRCSASLISAFCQESFAGLSLKNLQLDYKDDSGPVVEAKGVATRENTVFTLRDHLAHTVGSRFGVVVNSLRPQSRVSKPGEESLFEFSVSIAPNEAVQSK